MCRVGVCRPSIHLPSLVSSRAALLVTVNCSAAVYIYAGVLGVGTRGESEKTVPRTDQDWTEAGSSPV